MYKVHSKHLHTLVRTYFQGIKLPISYQTTYLLRLDSSSKTFYILFSVHVVFTEQQVTLANRTLPLLFSLWLMDRSQN